MKACSLGALESCEMAVKFKTFDLLLTLSLFLLFIMSTSLTWYFGKPRGWARKSPLIILLGLGSAVLLFGYLLDFNHVTWFVCLVGGLGPLLTYPLKKYFSLQQGG
jgi:hypothetical protein